MKAKKKIGNPKPLVVGQKVYVMLWVNFTYIEGTLKYKGPTKAIVEFSSDDSCHEECYSMNDVVAKNPKTRKILSRMKSVSKQSNDELYRLRNILDMLKA